MTREAIHAAAGLARGHLRVLRVPGEATVTRASLVSIVRAHRESLRELHAHASRDGERGWWTPKHVHALVSAASPKFRRLAVDVRSRGVCPALLSQLQSPVVRVRRLDVRAASLAPAEKIALFDAARRLRGRAAEMRRATSSQSLNDETLRLSRSPGVVSRSNPDPDRDPDPDALRSVAVSSCGLDGDDAAALAEAVGVDLEDDVEDDVATSSSSAMDLDLSDNPGMGCRGASALAPLVARGAVASLDLENCGIGESGAEALAEALASPRCALRRLNLSRNFIGATGVRRVAEGAARGAAARSARPSNAGAPLLALLVSHNAFGCEGATALADAAETSDAFARLEILDATMNGIGPAGVAALARATLGGSGAPALRELRLAGNPVGAAGARALARACATPSDSNLSPPTLETLTLGSARLGVVGAAAVAWAMSRPRGRLARVARLDLSANDIGECGAAIRVTGGEIVGFGGDGGAAKSPPGTRTTPPPERGRRPPGTRTPRRRYRRWRTTSRPLAVSVDWTWVTTASGTRGRSPSPPRWRERRRRRRATRTRTNEAAALLPPNEAAALLPPNAAAALLPPNAAAASNWTYSETRSETPARWRWRRR